MLNKHFQPSELMPLIEVAEFLGIGYFHARKIFLHEENVGFFQYGRKRLWKRKDIVEFKERHFMNPNAGKNGSNENLCK